MNKTYKSAIDLWLALILVGVPLFIVFTGVSVAFGFHLLRWHENWGRIAGMVFAGSGLLLGGAITALTVPCRYILDQAELHIQCGIFQSTVAYRSIRRLELSCSLWVAPALSLNRVKIVIDDGFYVVSPRDRLEFVRDLQDRIDQQPSSTT
ncbi:MAG: PH domain-containing protein [Nibricoccus sp.]